MDLAKDSIDLGIVVRDLEACRRFYGEELGFPFEAELAMPGGARMYRYRIGTTVLKLVKTAEDVPEGPVGMWAQGGIRYFTVSVRDMDAMVERLEGLGHKFVVPLQEIRPGVRIAILPDPDGNMVELLQISAG
jgi:catechol 2,3-dioxygenase-like lactoylglutathione lyase family enzyme